MILTLCGVFNYVLFYTDNDDDDDDGNDYFHSQANRHTTAGGRVYTVITLFSVNFEFVFFIMTVYENSKNSHSRFDVTCMCFNT